MAQKTLAKEITIFVHGEEAYKQALKITDALFNGNIKELSYDELKDAIKSIPSFEVTAMPLIDLLVQNNIASSKREAREWLQAGSISINGEVCKDENKIIDVTSALYHEIIVVRRGKKKYYVGIFK